MNKIEWVQIRFGFFIIIQNFQLRASTPSTVF